MDEVGIRNDFVIFATVLDVFAQQGCCRTYPDYTERENEG